MFRWLTVLIAILLPAAAMAAEPVRLTPKIMPCQQRLGPEWQCLTVDPRPADALPAHWSLLIDRARFDAIEVEAVGREGHLERQSANQNALGSNWSLGDNLRFDIASPPASLALMRLSFRNIDAIGFIRAVKAVSPEGHAIFEARWRTLVAFVVGVLVCSLLYNLFLRSWSATRFRVWYVLWLLGGIIYTLIWSGCALSIYPILSGNLGLTICDLLVGWMVGAAAMFLFTLIEPGLIGLRLIRVGKVAAGSVLIAAVIAATRWPIAPAISDFALNVTLACCAIVGLTAAVQALRNHSRAIVFYLIGWLPAFTVFGLRVARNLGLMGQLDWIDMATFGTMAFEAMMLSLAIADRYRTLERQNQQGEIERQALQRAAHTDSLTGLANRAAFSAALGRLADEAQTADLVLADLDQLKDTNDVLGHHAGDALIREAGARLVAAAGSDALVARVGGDEFAVLLLNEQSARLPAIFALFDALPTTATEGPAAPKMSAGHVTWTRDSTLPAQMYRDADLALYRAKGEGRGTCRSFDVTMRDEDNARSRVLIEAHAGLLRHEFELLYRPVVDLRSHEIVSHDALLRWNHPSRGLLLPLEFEAVLHDPGVAAPLQSRVLDMALEAVADFRSGIGQVTVEFVASQLAGAPAVDAILARIAHYGLSPTVLTAQLTGTVGSGSRQAAMFAALDRLRSAGVKVAFDHFGTGVASLAHLRDLPADIIKIDDELVGDLAGHTDSAVIVRAMIGFAHNLGKRTLGGDVETEAQRLALETFGCDLGQGPLIGRAAPAFGTERQRAAS